MTVALQRRAWTADDFHAMTAAGVLAEDDRVELIEGEVVEMAPVGSRHAATVKSTARILQRQVGERFLVSVQDPIRLSAFSEPQPDLALLEWRDDLYRDELPDASSVVLVIEVADSSLATDREIKLALYARAGIAEAWLVDLVAGTVEVHTGPAPAGPAPAGPAPAGPAPAGPAPAGYARCVIYRAGERVVSAALADLVVFASEVLVVPG